MEAGHHPTRGQRPLKGRGQNDCPGSTDEAMSMVERQEHADADGQDASAYGGEDCDDSDGAIYPGADELCDEVDRNCDGLRHAGASDAGVSYKDTDGDGYGSPEITLTSCGVPWPYVTNSDDCNDTDATSTILAEDADCDGVPDGCFLTGCDLSVDLGDGIGVDFVLITNGDGTDLEDPLGRYTLTNDFYMMTTEVTQGMFEGLMGYNPSTYVGDYKPVESLSWEEAAQYANALSAHQELEE